MPLLAGAFLMLSGIASLTYQVVWVRLLGLSLGSTSESVGTVLCAFFLGMAVGSWIADGIVRRRPGSLLPYIALEIIIGARALLLLPALLNLDALLAFSPAFGSALALKFGLALALMIIPTLCIGATFPVLAAILVRRDSEIGLRLGQLYALNTAGTVLGAALGGFLFIPLWGLDGAVYIAVSLNAAIVILGLIFKVRFEIAGKDFIDTFPKSRPTTEAGAATIAPPFAGRALAVLFATGLVAIASQVGWTRYLSIFTGTTIYGFAMILMVFLSGLADGSWAIRRHMDQITTLPLRLTAGLLAIAIALIGTLPPMARRRIQRLQPGILGYRPVASQQ